MGILTAGAQLPATQQQQVEPACQFLAVGEGPSKLLSARAWLGLWLVPTL